MFRRGVVFLFCIVVFLADAKNFGNWNPDFQSTSDVADRIVGGNTAQRNQFPYQAALRYASDLSHFCGGAIIGVSWVVTVQHCVIDHSPESFEVAVGAHALRFDAILYEVSRLVMHSNSDIALVQTRIPIVMLFGRVASIAFSAQHIGANVAVRSSGWGYTSLNGMRPEYLQYIDLVTLTNIDCKSRHAALSHLVADDNLCAFSGARGRGMCLGDSGAPLVAGDQLVGLLSWGELCAIGRPDAFVRLSHFYDWIVETMSID